jgi:CheY-like chemotaxis protein
MMAGPMILVVDDQASIRDLVAEILTDEGYQINTCANGQEALDCLSIINPQLVITDVMMPVLDGWTFTQRLRQNENRQNIFVIMMSAANELPFNPQYLDRYTSFLAKPFNITSLLHRVESSLNSEI